MAKDVLQYLNGFGNEFQSEAIPGTLPHGKISPQKPSHGLYAEQLSGSAFTALPHQNQRSWFYRILPSVKHKSYERYKNESWQSMPFDGTIPIPDQLRWDPIPYPKGPVDFVDGIFTMCGNGSCRDQNGSSIHLYAITAGMKNRALVCADGDLMFIPQEGELRIRTEFGVLDVPPGFICVVQRGIKMHVDLKGGAKARGYVCENYGAHFQLPYRGPIGANGLANARDFESPVAAFEGAKKRWELITKFCGNFFTAELDHSPFDVVGWFGNYVPYRYDLSLFNTMGSISFDHPDPSIFTVLTSQTSTTGVANVDFVIFPPRWLVAEDTFRPPYYHRNIMSEFMGLVHGVYDAKPAGGFVPGGSSLHNCMSAHGPETEAFEGATKATLKPQKLDDTLAFMWESHLVYQPSAFALEGEHRQTDYLDCWVGLKSHFKK